MRPEDSVRHGGRRQHGFTLVEIVVAIALLAVAVGPLFQVLLSVREKEDTWEQQMATQAASPATGRAASWTWGSQIRGVHWSGAGELIADTRDAGALIDPLVGIWADGWLVVSESVDADVADVVGSKSLWESLDTGELILRMRGEGEPWGPPTRIALPPSAPALLPAGTGERGASAGAEEASSWASLHFPDAGVAAIELRDADGGSSVVEGASPARAGIIASSSTVYATWSGIAQSWYPFPGRHVHVFF